MKKLMKDLAVIGIMASLAAGMAGCGVEGKADPVADSSPAETESNDSSSEETVSSDSGNSNDDEKKKVVVFSKKREWEKGWNALADAYMKEHPDVEVVINLTDANNYYDELKAYLASGDLPDIIQTVPGTTLSLWQDNLVPLNDLEVLDKMDQDIVNEYLVDGNYYGVPLFMELHGVIYNMDYLNQVGYDKAPETLDEFIDLNKKLQEAGLPTGISPWKGGGSIVGHMTAPVFSSHEDSLDYMHQIQNGEIDLKEDEGWNSLLDYLDATMEYGNKDALATDTTTERNALYAEQYAWYAHDGSWLTPAIKETNPDLEDHIQLGVYPYTNDADKNKIGRSTQSLSVMKTSRNAEDAKAFLDWMLGSDEACEILVKQCNVVLLRNDYEMNAEDIGTLSKQGLDYVKEGRSYANFRNIPDEATTEISAAFEKYLGGVEDRNAVLDEFQQIFENTKE